MKAPTHVDTKKALSLLKVVIVDDVRDMLKLLRTMLGRIGVNNVVIYESPEDALNISETRAPDLVIVDWELGGQTAAEFIHAFRQTRAARRRTGYFVITGLPILERVSEAQRLGIDGFLAKPVSPKVLREHLVRYLEMRAGKDSQPTDEDAILEAILNPIGIKTDLEEEDGGSGEEEEEGVPDLDEVMTNTLLEDKGAPQAEASNAEPGAKLGAKPGAEPGAPEPDTPEPDADASGNEDRAPEPAAAAAGSVRFRT